MNPEKLLVYLLETAQDLLDTTTYESQTHRAAVIVHWLAGLIEATAPEIVPTLISISDPQTGEAVEEITGPVLLQICLRLTDNTEISGQRMLLR